ncbi:MAG: preprotein translocase subunit SecY [Clostridia bacterium]|nr:preprotein translocase subunit SecY [Clostridia bacterium]
MLDVLKNAWKVVELRKKIFYTLLIILIFRVGAVVPVPFVNLEALAQTMNNTSAVNEFFSYISALTGAGLENGAIFSMSVTPYINASIIMQLLSVAFPFLERIAKEGEEGRKKIAKYTRFATVILGLIQGTAYYFFLKGSGLVQAKTTFEFIFTGVVIVLCFTAGSAIMMWLGERIDEKGIGNGISMLLFAGIISRFPSAISSIWAHLVEGKYIEVILVVLLFVVIIGFIVWMTGAERQVPVQYAKRVVGRKMYGGQNSHIPIQVNMSGVMPIIFASSFLAIPQMICGFMGAGRADHWLFKICAVFTYQGVFYALIYLAMIIGFAYFYVQIQYNPVEMANNLRKNSGAIPGIRAGKPTADYLKKIMSRITLIGAIFLGALAVLPIAMSGITNIDVTLGGTSVLIVVGVALDTVRTLESQLMMRHYKGFLD